MCINSAFLSLQITFLEAMLGFAIYYSRIFILGNYFHGKSYLSLNFKAASLNVLNNDTARSP